MFVRFFANMVFILYFCLIMEKCDSTIGFKESMKANSSTPAFAAHPGEIIKDEIEFRGISQRMLARQMGIQYSVVNEILNAHRPLTEKTALLFEAALGIDAEPLMQLQLKYNMQATRKDPSFVERLADIRKT